jgi:hypothetical protein
MAPACFAELQSATAHRRFHKGQNREQAGVRRCEARGVAKSFTIDNIGSMRSPQPSFRILTWCCVILLAVLSLLPEQDLMRTGIPGELEHIVAYAGSSIIAIAGYGQRQGTMRIIGLYWIYAGILEFLQHLSPSRHPSIADFFGIGPRSAHRGVCRGLPHAEPAERRIFGRHLI